MAVDLGSYRAGWRARYAAEQAALAVRHKRAWRVARLAARLLKEQFGATRVALFGSTLHQDRFTPWSDVDIAVWGLAPADTFKAVAAVTWLDEEIAVDMVDVTTCRPAVRAVIEHESVAL